MGQPAPAQSRLALARAGQLVELRVTPDGHYDGWDGRDVLCHLAAFARVVAAVLRGAAEGRPPSDTELYGRELSAEEAALTDLDAINESVRQEYQALSYAEALAFWRAMHADALAQLARLTDERLAAPAPPYPTSWAREHLADVVTALTSHYAGHMAH